MRVETDFIGQCEVPKNAYFGIHSVRARNNFPDCTPFFIEWYKAMGETKLACFITYNNYKKAISNKFDLIDIPLKFFSDEVIDALKFASQKISEGEYFSEFIVPAVQGGAGTSINMNINEIISNIALKKLGFSLGEYLNIDPIEHSNIFQSTNDTVPTSLRIAVMRLLIELEDVINATRNRTEQLETEYRDVIRSGYTQLQEAVPTSYGKMFGAFNQAFSRDWWRVSKCFERIKTVNLGGSAIGTGITVPTYFIMEVVPVLRQITNLPLTRSENLSDATSNLDSWVEVHATLKAHAVNLEKFVNDLRLLSSDLITNKEIHLPQKQVGSSIMPGKVNPVIVEYIISLAHKIYANDMLITSLSSQGQLELNAYIPQIGHAIIDSLKLLIGANTTLIENLLNDIKIDKEIAHDKLMHSLSITTALIPLIGYHKASELALYMQQNSCTIFDANLKLNIVDNKILNTTLRADNLLKLGYNINDINK